MILGAALEFQDLIPNVEQASLSAEYFDDYLKTANDPQFVGSCALAVRRDLFQQVYGFEESMLVHEDHDLFLRLGTSPGLVRIRAPITVAYRRHAGSISMEMRALCRGALDILSREIEGRYPGGKDRQFERWKLLSSAIRGVAVSCLQARAWNEAWRIYRRSFWMHIRLGRIRFLAGFPLYSLRFMLGRLSKKTPAALSSSTVPRGLE